MAPGISLANKCQLLFGFAVAVILGASLTVPWVWTASMVTDSQREIMRVLAEAWLRGQVDGDAASPLPFPPPEYTLADDPVRISLLRAEDGAGGSRTGGEFVDRALRLFRETTRNEYVEADAIDDTDVYHYARAIRVSDISSLPWLERSLTPSATGNDALVGVLLIDRRSEYASGQLLITRIYIVAAWLFGSLLAILVFYLILTRLVFSPVRKLRETAEKVQAGDTSTRASIQTGDEFEQLSDAFNSMVEGLSDGQRKLRQLNETLDLRLSELAEANYALYESNRLKGEFLASVSHELRTPLNSIIGFSELLDEMARSDRDADPKRRRYLSNILTSARSLLEMINDLLEMAKIEAGRIELSIESISPADLAEGLESLTRPQAQQRDITLQAKVQTNLPLIETDAGKLQQILYNFISNALKFTPTGGTITISVERVTRQDAQGVRFGVIDTGPGIPQDLQDVIFEKFRQADASHTREHQGVGLGLAICRELADVLGATLSVVSEPGRGAAFYVEVPMVYEPPKPRALMEPESAARRAAERVGESAAERP